MALTVPGVIGLLKTDLIGPGRPTKRIVRSEGMTPKQIVRVALGYLFLFSVQIGAWALIAPRSFYDDFPGAGRSWISIDGPYNEHLVRDVGALNLAIAVIVLWAAVTLAPTLIRAAAVAAMVWGVPHLVYHLTSTDGLTGSDLVGSLGGLLLFVVLPVAALWAAPRLTSSPTPDHDPAAAQGTSHA